ncbi:hypothetical protein Q1M63_19350 [Sinorhizobium meliloti]|nr:hypothetical protein Q1M63_19350 [Sinorhizobium meliloti]
MQTRARTDGKEQHCRNDAGESIGDARPPAEGSPNGRRCRMTAAPSFTAGAADAVLPTPDPRARASPHTLSKHPLAHARGLGPVDTYG